jgi:hypothetical protein
MAAVARILGLMLAALAGAASAQPPTPPRIGGAAPGPCVTVEIAGDRAGHLDCASERLQEAARTAQAQARTQIGVPDATSPDVATGVASQTATRQRMGSAFGVSVQPQRPNRPPPLPRPGGRR